MTAEEITKLVESAVTKAVAEVQKPVAGLTQRALRGDAMVEANRVLKSVTLHEAAKQLVVENALRDIPVKDGELDTQKFGELVMAEAKRVGAAIGASTGSGHVTGMGTGLGIVPDKAERKRLKEARKAEKKADKRLKESAVQVWQDFGLDEAAAKRAAEGRVA